MSITLSLDALSLGHRPIATPEVLIMRKQLAMFVSSAVLCSAASAAIVSNGDFESGVVIGL
jgi:hypothetical protein